MRHAASFDMFWLRTLFSQTFSECCFAGLIVVNPGGVTCPPPSLLGRVVEQISPAQNVVGRELLVDTGRGLVVVEDELRRAGDVAERHDVGLAIPRKGRALAVRRPGRHELQQSLNLRQRSSCGLQYLTPGFGRRTAQG